MMATNTPPRRKTAPVGVIVFRIGRRRAWLLPSQPPRPRCCRSRLTGLEMGTRMKATGLRHHRWEERNTDEGEGRCTPPASRPAARARPRNSALEPWPPSRTGQQPEPPPPAPTTMAPSRPPPRRPATMRQPRLRAPPAQPLPPRPVRARPGPDRANRHEQPRPPQLLAVVASTMATCLHAPPPHAQPPRTNAAAELRRRCPCCRLRRPENRVARSPASVVGSTASPAASSDRGEGGGREEEGRRRAVGFPPVSPQREGRGGLLFGRH
jgi:hypothetical protein